MKYFLRTKVLLTFSLAWVVVSVGLSLWYHDWSWFGRSGAILTLSGAVLTVRPLLRLGPDGFYRDQHTIDGGHAVPTAEEKAAEREGRDDVGASYIGFFCAVIGTIIWAYGDLIQ
jgi:hypothetical protein